MRYCLMLLLILAGCTAEYHTFVCNNSLCNDVYAELIEQSQHVDCAFYSLRSQQIIDALDNANARVVMHKPIDKPYVKAAQPRGLMHNKFCVTKHMVITGSYNPYDEGREELNNVVKVRSRRIAKLYQAEFEEMWQGTFGGGQPTPPQFGSVRAYFCPEDDCAAKLIHEIEQAKHSIEFAYFSFTSGEIALALIQAKQRGVEVEGMLEEAQLSQYSQYEFFKQNGIRVKLENTSAILHHKLMKVDNTLITGSFNPTKSGQLRNDENLLIVGVIDG